MKANIIIFLILILVSSLLTSGEAATINVSDIIAYPVPFNPRTQILKIGYRPSLTVIPEFIDKVILDIFDINGDRVFTREYTSLNTPILWNGLNTIGKNAKPGLYIIKLRVENSISGAFNTKIIRIAIIR